MMKFEEQQLGKAENKESSHMQTTEISSEQAQSLEEYSHEKIASIQYEQLEVENNGNAEMNRLRQQYKPGAEVVEKYKSKVDEFAQKSRAEASQAIEKIVKVVQSEEFDAIADAASFAVGVKQTIKELSGKILSGEELYRVERVVHTAKGFGSFALDLSRIGRGEKEKGKRVLRENASENVFHRDKNEAAFDKALSESKGGQRHMRLQDEAKRIEKFIYPGGAKRLEDYKQQLSEIGVDKKETFDLKKTQDQHEIDTLMREWDFEKTLKDFVLPGLEERVSGFELEQIDEFETYFQEDEKSGGFNYDGRPDEYMNYWAQRSFLSREDIKEIKEAVGDNNLEAFVRLKISEERKDISSILNKAENNEKIKKCTNSIKGFFDENGILISRKDLPKTQFIGKYDAMMLASANQGELVFGDMFDGGYVPTLDGVFIKMSPDDVTLGNFQDQYLRAYIHEIMHSISERKIVSDKQLGVDDGEAKYLRGGFLSRNKKGRRRNSLNSLNEGATELFSRMIAKKAGISTEHDFGEEGYDIYVRDTETLLKKIGDQSVVDEDISREAIVELLNDYTRKEGILKIGRLLNEKIGPHALVLFDILSGSGRENNFYNFIISLEDFRAGREVGKIIIRKDDLQNYSVSEDVLLKNYPFLEFK